MDKPKVVIGDGWAALAVVASLLPENPVCWISGSRTRISPALPGLSPGPAVERLKNLAARWDLDLGDSIEGDTLREYRGKAFKEPSWNSDPDSLWTPEKTWVHSSKARFSLALCEIEERLHSQILSRQGLPLRRIEGLPVTSLGHTAQAEHRVVLGSGEEILCSEIYYADRWSLLPSLEGLPRPLSFLRNRSWAGVLQANFVHKCPVGRGVAESFVAGLHREPGEEIERHVWGYFFGDGSRSSWTVCLTPEEVEDNHTVAKKFRRMKSTLDRIFSGSEIVPQGYENFGATLEDEQVRFEEEAVFFEGKPLIEPADAENLDHFSINSGVFEKLKSL
ncbi:MAG: hypothetical protein HYX41_08185 [Bdellovibrio sp.]|nr:hypothetical protein [Bdellovibrio sp.]